MKKKLILLSCIFVLLMSPSVFSAEGFYVSGNIGPSILSDSDISDSEAGLTLTADLTFDTGITFGGAIGYDFDKGRIELAVDYKSHDVDEWQDVSITGFGNLGDFSGDGEVTALSLLANGYFDIHTNSPVTPYLGGGIGFANIDVEDLTFEGIEIGDDDDTVFAYQAAVGIGIDVAENITVDVGYRFFGTSDPDFDGTEAEYHSHNIIAGLRVGL
jgi:opacity protein-like surface antigen